MNKPTARRRIREQRVAMGAEGREEAARRLARVLMQGLATEAGGDPTPTGRPDGFRPLMAAFLSAGEEPGTHPLLTALNDAGYDVAVPVCEADHQLSWAVWYPDVPLQLSRFAPVPEPVGPRHGLDFMAGADLLFIPALAVDTAGNRLGQGGGYYDRFLFRLRTVPDGPRVVGVVYSDELVPAGTFEHSALDVPLDGVITPDEWRWFGSGNDSEPDGAVPDV